MKPAPFAFRRPATLGQALSDLASEPGAKVLAGGQSLVPLLSMRLAAPETIIDVNALSDLDCLTVGDDGVRIGALARHARVLASAEVRRCQPLVTMALSHVAHPTIRNRGTVVGSIVHADPAAEMPMVLLLLGGTLDVASRAGTRTIAAADLFAGPLESTVRPAELATSAWVPALAEAEGVAFAEIARRHGDYASVGVGAIVEASGGRLTRARVGYLSVADVPTVVDLTEALTGADADDLADAAGPVVTAGDLAVAALDPAADLHASADYRAHLVRVLTARVLRAAHAHAIEREGRSA